MTEIEKLLDKLVSEGKLTREEADRHYIPEFLCAIASVMHTAFCKTEHHEIGEKGCSFYAEEKIVEVWTQSSHARWLGRARILFRKYEKSMDSDTFISSIHNACMAFGFTESPLSRDILFTLLRGDSSNLIPELTIWAEDDRTLLD